MTQARVKPRRTQEERRATTRAALLNATVECLVEFGYSGVTTTKVVERAGVSRGAQVHHFPTKAQLVAEAVAHLADLRIDEMAGRLEQMPGGARRTGAVLDLMWQMHSGRLFQAALELWVAARSDPELRRHAARVEREVSTRVWTVTQELFPEVAARPGFEADIETALATMRGLALLQSVTGSRGDGVQRRWLEARKRLERMLSAA